jgi:ABC-type xylose transport system permease subunit
MQRVLVSFACGLILTAVLTGIGLSQGSREGVCVFIWQGCLVQLILNATDTPVDGGSTKAWFSFMCGIPLGVLLGVPIYSLISYGFLTAYARVSKKPK